MSKVFNYKRRYNSLHNRLGDFSVNIYAYDGEGDTDWADDESGNLLPSMRRVCTLKADLSGLRNVLKVQKGPNDQDFWVIEFMIDVRFGGTTLKASMKWYEGVSIQISIQKVLIFGCVRHYCAMALSALYQTQSTRSRLPSIMRKWEARSNERFSFCIILFDTIDNVKQLTRGYVGNVLC